MVLCDDLKYIYKKSNKGLTKLSVALQKEHVYGLLGKNGSGKTTLLYIISSLLFPQNGACTIDSISATMRNPKVLQNFYVFPEDIFDISMSAQKFVDHYSMFYPNFDRYYFQTLAQDLDIQDSLSSLLHKLSLGQRKKVFIAFALATKVQVLLFDEPTNGLDIPSRTALKSVIYKNAHSNNQIVLISTHNIRDIENLVSSYIFIDKGEHLFTVDTETIFTNFILKKHGTPTQKNALYTCKVFDGYASLLENKRHKLEEFDLEIFFTMALNEQGLQNMLATLGQPVIYEQTNI